MNENNNIDDLFKNGISKEYPFDPTLWSAIEPNLPAHISRKPFLWFNFNTLLLGGILFLCAFISADNSTKTIQASNNYYTEQNKNTISPFVIYENTDDVKNKANEDIKSNRGIESPEQETLKVTATSKDYSSYSNQLSSASSTSITKNKNNISNDLIDDKINRKQTINRTKKASNNNLLVSNTSVNSSKNINSNKYSFNDKSAQDSVNSISATSFARLTLEEIDANAFKLTSPTLNSVPKKAIVKVPFTGKKKYYYSELETSTSLSVVKQLSGSNKDLIALKKATEKSKRSSAIGWNVFKTKKAFSYGTGVHYVRYIEESRFTLPTETIGYVTVYDTSYQVISNSYNSNGTPVLLLQENIDSRLVNKQITIDSTFVLQNKIERIQIPVFVGYNINYKAFTTEIRTSLAFNYLVQKQGYYISADLVTPVNFEESNEFNSTVISSKAAAGIGYSINEFTAVGVRFSYETDLTSFTKNYNSKLQSKNIGLWIRWSP